MILEQCNKMSDRTDLLTGLKQRVGCCVDEAKEKLHTLSKDIWSCPELAYEETKSHDRLVAFFGQEEGWRVDSHFKLQTAFQASWGTGGSERVSCASTTSCLVLDTRVDTT